MGFWTDKEKDENKQPFGEQDNINNQFFSSQFNTFKQCRNDPEDNKYIICKNITQKLNKDGQFEGSESEEERIPANEFYNRMQNPLQGISPFFGMMDNLLNQPVFPFNGLQNQDTNQPKDNSFFGKLKSLFNDDSLEKDIQKYYTHLQKSLTGQQDTEEQSQNQQPKAGFQKVYSRSSRSCKQDPEDENYMICTTTVKKYMNGQESTEEKQERIQTNGQQQNAVHPNSINDIFKEMNNFPPMFSPFTFGAPVFNQNQDPSFNYNQNENENENRQNRDNSRKYKKSQSNNYKYPAYEEKKNNSNGIYDL